MPLLKSRFKYTKVFRPNGTKYGQGRDESYTQAIIQAMCNFDIEFGRPPAPAKTVIEVVGGTFSWTAQVFELEGEFDV